MRVKANSIGVAVLLFILPVAISFAADTPFHDAPASAKAMKNPLAGQAAAVDAGKLIYTRNCLACHGKTLQGTGNVPSLVDGKLKGVTAGELFWFITKGDKDNGMPSWAALPDEQRWQVVSFVEAMASGKGPSGSSSPAAPEAAGAKITGDTPKP